MSSSSKLIISGFPDSGKWDGENGGGVPKLVLPGEGDGEVADPPKLVLPLPIDTDLLIKQIRGSLPPLTPPPS